MTTFETGLDFAFIAKARYPEDPDVRITVRALQEAEKLLTQLGVQVVGSGAWLTNLANKQFEDKKMIYPNVESKPHPDCDESCMYHCTEAGQHPPSCIENHES